VLVGALQLVCRTVAVVCCAAAALSVPVCGPPCCSCLLRAPLRLPCALPQLALGSIVSVDGLQHVVACSKSVQPPQIDRAAVLCVCWSKAMAEAWTVLGRPLPSCSQLLWGLSSQAA